MHSEFITTAEQCLNPFPIRAVCGRHKYSCSELGAIRKGLIPLYLLKTGVLVLGFSKREVNWSVQPVIWIRGNLIKWGSYTHQVEVLHLVSLQISQCMGSQKYPGTLH